MRDTRSMILGDGDEVKPIIDPSARKGEANQVHPVLKQVEPLLPSGNEGVQPTAIQIAPQSSDIIESAPIPKFESLTDFTNEIYKARMPSDEELTNEKKREKSRAVIAAIADGVSAISNLYFTGKGANNVEQGSLSVANTKRYQDILDRRRKTQDEWDHARLSAYDRDRGVKYQMNRDKNTDERYISEWNRNGQWHDGAIARENTIRRENKERQDRIDKETKDFRDKEFYAQEKARKDASARGWAVVGAKNKQSEVQDRRQREKMKYQFGKLIGSPEPKRINHTQSIYVSRNVWEQNAGQIAGEIRRDLLKNDSNLARNFERDMNGGFGGKGLSAKEMAAIVDKYIMDSPSAQRFAIELEKDYKKQNELATDGLLSNGDPDDLGFTPSSPGKGKNVDVDPLFD